ncbi:MAG TPA: DNA-directed RNA polymerase subunit omega [bacterium]|nr:DNA-directed RNA polymerase subunit omega [bacterium]HPJ72368.1 DNA-directed RNA polymerase subunit omega [bacterium]HPQ65137.1 DNA-directed RNA polymerase subunit omega [bacterium]
MKQLTSEKFIEKVHSPYQLVLMAAQRAAQLSDPQTPSRPTIPVSKNEKPPLVALEEIAEDKVVLIPEGELDV